MPGRLWQTLHRTTAPVRRWGAPGLVGIISLLAAAILATQWLPGLRTAQDALRQQADAQVRQARRQSLAPVSTEPDPTTAQSFITAFPQASERQNRLEQLLQLAGRHGLAMKPSDYRLEADRAISLARYSVTLPLSGTYAQLRAFIDAALAQDPALSLDQLRLRRPSADATTLDIDLVWSLHMQAEVATVSAPAALGLP